MRRRRVCQKNLVVRRGKAVTDNGNIMPYSWKECQILAQENKNRHPKAARGLECSIDFKSGISRRFVADGFLPHVFRGDVYVIGPDQCTVFYAHKLEKSRIGKPFPIGMFKVTGAVEDASFFCVKLDMYFEIRQRFRECYVMKNVHNAFLFVQVS